MRLSGLSTRGGALPLQDSTVLINWSPYLQWPRKGPFLVPTPGREKSSVVACWSADQNCTVPMWGAPYSYSARQNDLLNPQKRNVTDVVEKKSNNELLHALNVKTRSRSGACTSCRACRILVNTPSRFPQEMSLPSLQSIGTSTSIFNPALPRICKNHLFSRPPSQTSDYEDELKLDQNFGTEETCSSCLHQFN